MTAESTELEPSFAGKQGRRAAAMGEWLMARRRLVYNAALIFLVIFSAALILQHAHWPRTQEFHGPFEADPTGISQYRVAIGTDIPFLSIPSLRSWSEGRSGEASALQLWINGKAWSPPEASEPSINQGKLFGIAGLYRTLQFDLPAGVANDSSTVLRVAYQVRVHTKLYSFIALIAGLFVLLAVNLAVRSANGVWLRSLSLRSVPPLRLAMQLASWALITGCVVYAGSIAYGMAIADALPTATVFRLFPASNVLTGIASFAPHGVLIFAALGAAISGLGFLTQRRNGRCSS